MARDGGYTTSDGVGLRVRDDRATGDGATLPTLVLVHGWSQDLRTWDRVVTDLRRGDWTGRIVRHDHRGHGGSGPAPRGTATIGRAADDLAGLIAERVPDGPIVLAGHSMGGMTIMALAERHPDLVAERVVGVAFVATASDDMAELDLGLPGRRGRLVARGEHLLLPLTMRVGDRIVPRGAGRRTDEVRETADPGRTARLRAAAIAPGVRALVFGRRPRRADVLSVAEQALAAHQPSVAAFRTSIGEHRRTAALATLRGVPVAVLVGDHDRLCPRRHASVIADALPDAAVVLYPGAGHMITFERSGEVAGHVRGLLDRATAAPHVASTDPERSEEDARVSA